MIHKKITSSLFAFTIAACSIQAAPATAIAKDAKLEQQVEATLSKMTLEEKIGQMTELAIDVLGGFVDGEFQLDEAKLRKAKQLLLQGRPYKPLKGSATGQVLKGMRSRSKI